MKIDYKHFLLTGEFIFEQLDIQPNNFEANAGEVDLLMHQLATVEASASPSQPNTAGSLHINGANYEIQLGRQDLMMPQHLVAEKYNMNKIFFSKEWKRTAGKGQRWPYRQLMVLSRMARKAQNNLPRLAELESRFESLIQANLRKLTVRREYIDARQRNQLERYYQPFKLWSPSKFPTLQTCLPPLLDTNANDN